jgi:beta-lactamase class D
MTRPTIVATLTLAISVALAAQGPARTERADWAHFFSDASVPGTIVVADERAAKTWVYNEARAKERLLPASTFKVPHTLFALDAGLVTDEFQVFKWDGVPRGRETWDRDQTLRTAMRSSTVWVFQEVARKLGERREREYLQRIGYGNADASGGVDRFWLDGGLRISALEQVAFLQRLYRNTLPFKVEHQRLVKDLMINEAGRDWILRAKTGWAATPEREIGWWVGWVERTDGAVFFALNIDMPKKGDDTPKRESIARAVLRSIDALPR